MRQVPAVFAGLLLASAPAPFVVGASGVRAARGSTPPALPFLQAADFYVDAVRGDDGNDGQLQRPFRSIGRAVAAMVSPGSVCSIRAGVYREAVRFEHSGTAERPLRFQAEPGAVLSGADAVRVWVRSEEDPDSAYPHAPGLYYAVVGANPLRERGQIAVFLDGRIAPEARWPNDNGSYPWPTYAFCSDAGYDQDGRNGWIEDHNLPERPDGYWEGCRLIILAGHGWRGRDLPILRYTAADKRMVTDFENNKPGAPGNASLRGPVPRKQAGREPLPGNEYFVVADPAELAHPGLWIQNECDAADEWAYFFDRADPARSRLYLKTAGDPPRHVELRCRDVGLDFGDACHIQVTGLRLLGCRPVFGGRSRGILLQAMAMTYVDHQRVPGGEGIFVDGDDHVIRDCAIEWSAGNLVTFRSGRGHRFVNNLARGANYSTHRGGLLLWRGARDVLVSHCTLRDSGAMILAMHDAEGAIVEYCDIADGARLCTDLGLKYDSFIGTYCLRYNLWHGATSANHTGHGSSAIYLEDGGAQAIVHHNIVWDVDYGIQLNSSSTLHRLFHNTVGPCRQAAVLCGSNRQKMAVERFTSILANNVLSGNPIQARGIGIRGLVLRGNLPGGEPGFVDVSAGGFRLRQDSPARDAALPVAGLGVDVPDGAPDIGALEYGAPDWTRQVGHDFEGPPPEAAHPFPQLEYRTYTENYSFETPAEIGAGPAAWRLSGSAARVPGAFHDRANILTDVTARNGRFTIRIAGTPGEVRQTVSGLRPGSEYILVVGVRPGQENRVLTIGVEGHGGERRRKDIVMPLPADFLEAQHGGGHWTLGALRFTTGVANTTAEVFVGSPASTPEPVFVDTVMVVPAAPWHGAGSPPEPLTLDLRTSRGAARGRPGGRDYPYTVAAAAEAGGEGPGEEIRLVGDSWRVVAFDHAYTPFTVLEFEQRSSGPGTVQGVAIGADGTVHRGAVFLTRTAENLPSRGIPLTSGSLWKPLRTDEEGWEHYRVPIGQYLRYLRDYGVRQHLVFLNECAGDAGAECRFRRARIVERWDP
ncbi:MAG: right-handed parallel beta-helix repeat-containing protein [Lentisphaeria bacterium]|nr:right-handed parallel beta-helix repeat-containing protein [Lentisphaeria bacterium]